MSARRAESRIAPTRDRSRVGARLCRLRRTNELAEGQEVPSVPRKVPHRRRDWRAPAARERGRVTRNPSSPFAFYLSQWRAWRSYTEGRCEAACTDDHDGRKGRRCSFAGAWDGKSGRVLCRVHQDRYDQATGSFAFVDRRAA